MSNEYFAAGETEEIGEKLSAKVQQFRDAKAIQVVNGRLAKAYQYHFGLSPAGIHVASGVQRGGEQGELAEIRVNHLRANALTVHNLTVAPKVAWTAVATNADSESTKQAIQAVSLLEYYWLDREVAQYASQAVAECIPLTEGFVFTPWDDFAGETIAVDPMSGEGIPSGDFALFNVPPWDVIRDPSKKSWNQLDWVIVVLHQNKFDIAARFPDNAEDALNGPTDGDSSAKQAMQDQFGDSDDIPVYYFFHKRCPVLKGGRETVFLADGTVLRDGSLTYEQIPLHRVVPDELTGTPFGYSQYHEGIGIQEAIDSLQSAILTNQDAFTRQMVAVQRGEAFSVDDIAGLAVLTYNATPPQALQLTSSPAEAFKNVDTLKADLRRIQGVNDAVQGQLPGDAKLSGAALALLSSQAIQQNSVLQANYVKMVRSIGNCLLSEWRKRTPLPRKIKLVGKSSAFLCREEEMSGADVSRIKEVNVDIGNPMQQTHAGKMELAQLYIQTGGISSPEEIQQVVSTGRIEHLTKGTRDELLLILDENEQIADGIAPPAVIHDDHLRHGREHRSTLASTAARQNPAIIKASTDHLHEHYKLFFGWPDPMMPPPMPPIVGMNPMTGMPIPDPSFDPSSPTNDPMYRERMLILVGQQPPPPMMPGMPPPMAMAPPPAPGEAPPPPGEAVPPPPDQIGNKQKLPNMPTNPQTKEKYVTPGGQGTVPQKPSTPQS